MKKTFRALVLASVLGVAVSGAVLSPAMALRESKPIPTDQRLQTVVYSANEVYKFTGHYGYQSMFEFDKGEEVVTISMGDSVAWQIVPSGNRIFIKPVEPDATTNMTVVTNLRTYQFELHSRETENINDSKMVFVLRFIYGRGAGLSVSNFIDSVPDPLLEPEKYNFNYTLTGTEEIAPIKIFDDGEFTYFEFRDKNAEIPAFFQVHRDGSESLINFRTRDNFIVVERVAGQFTLRHGEDVVCIFNQTNPGLSSGPFPRPINDEDEDDAEDRRDRHAASSPKAKPAADPAKSTVKR